MGRAPCCDKANVKKGPWSPEEDTKLKEYIEKHGTGGNWIALPQKAGLRRCGKSCRLRWLNYLRPNLKHGEFSEEEDRIICSLFANIGSRWSIIAAQLPGRTDNDIKNYWNTKLKKKLMVVFPPHHNTPCPSESFSSSIYDESNSNYNRTPSTVPLKGHEIYMPAMLQTNRDTGLFGSMQMQYYAAAKESTYSSSDGNCSHTSRGREMKQQDENAMIACRIEENRKYMLHDYGIGSNTDHWVDISRGVGESPSDYHVSEDIKQLLITSTNYNHGFSYNTLFN